VSEGNPQFDLACTLWQDRPTMPPPSTGAVKRLARPGPPPAVTKHHASGSGPRAHVVLRPLSEVA